MWQSHTFKGNSAISTPVAKLPKRLAQSRVAIPAANGAAKAPVIDVTNRIANRNGVTSVKYWALKASILGQTPISRPTANISAIPIALM
jgi:hypothetical protein